MMTLFAAHSTCGEDHESLKIGTRRNLNLIFGREASKSLTISSQAWIFLLLHGTALATNWWIGASHLTNKNGRSWLKMACHFYIYWTAHFWVQDVRLKFYFAYIFESVHFRAYPLKWVFSYRPLFVKILEKTVSNCRISIIASIPDSKPGSIKPSRLDRPFSIKFSGTTKTILISFYYKQKPAKKNSMKPHTWPAKRGHLRSHEVVWGHVYSICTWEYQYWY